MVSEHDPYLVVVYKKLFESGDNNLVQIWFDRAVLDKYKGVPAFSIVRTDTIGRVSRGRIWSLDFGIGAEDSLIHASLSDLIQRLPDGEKEHWANHVVTLPFSLNFMQTRLAPASCADDGELRKWE